MSGIAPLALLYFTVFRWQRRLAIAGLVAFTTGVGLMAFSGFGPVLAIVGLASVLLPSATSSGFVLRALSAPRSQRLVPGFRCTMLMALGLVLTVEAALAALIWWLLAEQRSVTVLIEGLSFGALLTTCLLVWTFAATGPPLKTLLLLIGSYGLGAWVTQVGTAWLPVSAPLAAAPTCALLALLFGLWYRHARTIDSVGIFQSLSIPPALVEENSAATRASALYLGDRLPWRFHRRLASLTALAAAGAALVWVLDRLDRRIELPLSALLNLPLIVTFLGLPRVYRMLAHSRALWLRTPGLRAGVFRVCETEALRDVIWNVVFASLLVGGFILVRPSLSWSLLPWAALLYLSTGLLLAYLGLMLVRGPRPLDLTAGLLLAGLSFVALTPLSAAPPRPLPVAAIVAVEIAAALTLRSIAARRWTDIDWLKLRAARPRSHAVRAT